MLALFFIFIVGCIYRYYESRRRLFLDSLPGRVERKIQNDKKTKISQRQRSVSNGIDCSPIASVCIISGTRRDHNYHVIIYIIAVILAS